MNGTNHCESGENSDENWQEYILKLARMIARIRSYDRVSHDLVVHRFLENLGLQDTTLPGCLLDYNQRA